MNLCIDLTEFIPFCSSMLNDSGGIVADLLKPPLPETSETSTQNLFHNSAVANAFQLGISQTASSAASVLKTASRPRRLFSLAGLSNTLGTTSDLAQTSNNPGTDSTWNGFSALEVPHHLHDQNKDAFGMFDADKAAGQQSKPLGFFSQWGIKSPPLTNTPAILLAKKTNDSLLDNLSPDLNGHHRSLSSPQSSYVPPTGPDPSNPALADFPSSSCDPSPEVSAAPSRMSLLFGRFASRNKEGTSLDTNGMISPSTNLSDRDVAFLDSIKTVPVEIKPALYDDFLLGEQSHKTSSSLNVGKAAFQARDATQYNSDTGNQDLFELLTQDKPSKPKISPKLSSRLPNPTSVATHPDQEPDPFDVFNTAPISIHPPKVEHRSYSASTNFNPPSKPTSASAKVLNPVSPHDDLDNLFSDFKSASPSPRMSHSFPHQPNIRPPSSSARSSYQRPALQSSSLVLSPPNPKPTTVRMVTSQSRTPTPIIQLAPPPSLSVAVPILRAPPSSSSSTNVPLIAPPNGTKSLVPNPILTPLSSNFNSIIPPPPQSDAPRSFVTPSSQTAHQPGGALSKQDLSFFDSLL